MFIRKWLERKGTRILVVQSALWEVACRLIGSYWLILAEMLIRTAVLFWVMEGGSDDI